MSVMFEVPLPQKMMTHHCPLSMGDKWASCFDTNKIGGGVSIFIKHNVEYRTRTDLNISNKFIQSLFIEIPKSSIVGSKNDVVVGVVYRPPDTDINVFTMYIKQILSTLKSESKIVYITDDFNINLLNIDQHIPSSEFVETMYTYSFFLLINKPTRIGGNCATLIDNIYCNNINSSKMMNGIFQIYQIISQSSVSKYIILLLKKLII